MQQLSLAAQQPGTVLLSRHQPADAFSIRPSVARRATTLLLLNAGLIANNGDRFCTPRVEVEKQGKPGEATMYGRQQ